MAPQDRGPNKDDKSRMDELRRRQTIPAGDPRVTGTRGMPGRPFHVYIEDAADKFFDSFRAPTPAQGPQRPEQTGEQTGEALFRAVLTQQEAVAAAAKDAASQLRIAADMAVQFTGGMGRYTAALREEQRAERTRIDLILSRIESHYDRLSRGEAEPGARRGRRGGEPPAPPSDPIGHPPTHPVPDLDHPNPDGSFPPAPPTPPPGTPGGPGAGGGGRGGRPRPQPPEYGPERPPRADTGYEKLSHHIARSRQDTHGGMRRRVTRAAAEDYHQRYGQGTQRSPTVIPVTDDTGTLSHYEERGADGAVLRTVAADDPEAPSMARRAVRAAAVSRAAASLAQGRGLGGALMGGARGGAEAAGAAGGAVGEAAGGAAGAAGAVGGLATKAIPVVGWALAAADLIGKGFRFAQDQRAENAQFQSIYGGSNVEGIGQRVQQEGFKWGQFFTTGLKDEDAQKLFQGVSQMGYMDSERGNILDFAQKQYKNLGMSVDQSLKAIQIASAGANSGLTGLEQALTAVTKSARQSGQSADVMREKFLNVFAATTQAGYGTASASVASVLTSQGPGRSRDLQNADYSPMLNETNQRVTAAGLGMPYGAFVAQNAEGNTIPGLEQKDKQIKSVVNAVLNPGLKSKVDTLVQQHGGIDAVRNSPGARREIGLELLKTGQVDPGIVKQLGSAYGVDLSNVPAENTGEWIVDQYTGGGALAPKAKEAQAAQQQRKLAPGEFGGTDLWEQLTGKLPGTDFVQSNWGTNGLSGAVRNKNASLLAYNDLQQTNQTADPGIEAMIQSLGHYSEAGIEVQTKDGPKVVSQADAIKYYPDQVAKGDVTVVGGPADVAGRKVSELTGVSEKNFKLGDKTVDSASQPAAGAAGGVSPDEWTAQHPSSYDTAAKDAAITKVTIDMTPEMKKYFNITTTGQTQNGQVEAGASTGLPPSVGGK